jgi:hypothetical protein
VATAAENRLSILRARVVSKNWFRRPGWRRGKARRECVSYFTLGCGGYLLCWPNHRAIGDRPHGRFLLTWPRWLPPGGVFSICAAAVCGSRPAAIRGTGVTEYLGRADHSALMLAARITLPHFSVSSTMNLPNSTIVIDFGTLPTWANRAIILGSLRPASISLWSLSMISAGVFFGATRPFHTAAL